MYGMEWSGEDAGAALSSLFSQGGFAFALLFALAIPIAGRIVRTLIDLFKGESE